MIALATAPNLSAGPAITLLAEAAMANTGAMAFVSPIEARSNRSERGNIPRTDDDSAGERFVAISKLLHGWDGGKADPINPDALARAKRLVEFASSLPGKNGPPAIVPCADGSIQIEWHLPDSRFEMYLETDGSASAWWHDRASDKETEAENSLAEVLLGRWAVREAAWSTVAIAA